MRVNLGDVGVRNTRLVVEEVVMRVECDDKRACFHQLPLHRLRQHAESEHALRACFYQLQLHRLRVVASASVCMHTARARTRIVQRQARVAVRHIYIQIYTYIYAGIRQIVQRQARVAVRHIYI